MQLPHCGRSIQEDLQTTHDAMVRRWATSMGLFLDVQRNTYTNIIKYIYKFKKVHYLSWCFHVSDPWQQIGVPRKSWKIPNVSKCCMFALQLPLPWSFLMSKYVEMSCIRTLTRHQLQITDFDNFDSLGCAICPWAFMEDICSKWRQNIADDANGCASCKPCLCWYLARENTPFIIYRGFTRWSIPYILATHGKSRF